MGGLLAVAPLPVVLGADVVVGGGGDAETHAIPAPPLSSLYDIHFFPVPFPGS